MKLSDFDYNLPKELIAQYPLKQRDTARLLVLDREKGTIQHRIFKDITDYFKKGDLLVLNNTKVLPARIKGKRLSGGKVEVLLLNRRSGSAFNALIKPGRVKLSEKIIFNGGKTYGIVSAKGEITFNTQDLNEIYGLGVMPLPPYIKREAEDLDNDYYQTIYASQEGAIASPTAGLHFTQDLMERIKLFGVNTAFVTLHVGVGTFKPVKADDVTTHKMDAESFKIPAETVNSLKIAGDKNGRIFAVGTTSLRALETYACGINEGSTDLFIYPGYEFKIADCLLTNFHLPRTTLFMLVSAFGTEELMKDAYREAIDKKYRFYSYGDAMLII